MHSTQVTGPYVVTFYCSLAGRRGVLLDDLDEATAQQVAARYSDKSDRNTYLPQVRVELAVRVAA